MKSNDSTHSPDLPAEQRFVDGALQELSANGKHEDSDLIDSILLATIERPVAATQPIQPPPVGIKTWIAASGAVAAVLALVVATLSSLPFGNQGRNHSEVQFVVTMKPDLPSAVENPGAPVPVPLAGYPFQGEVEVVVTSTSFSDPRSVGANPSASKEEWSYPLPVAQASSDAQPNRERIQIDSDTVTRENGQLVYSGNVRLQYRTFLISAEQIRLEADPVDSAFLTAQNATFSTQDNEEFPVVSAEAGQLEIDPVTGLIRLQKVDRLETLENGSITIVDTQAVSITAAGYAIETRSDQ